MRNYPYFSEWTVNVFQKISLCFQGKINCQLNDTMKTQSLNQPPLTQIMKPQSTHFFLFFFMNIKYKPSQFIQIWFTANTNSTTLPGKVPTLMCILCCWKKKQAVTEQTFVSPWFKNRLLYIGWRLKVKNKYLL